MANQQNLATTYDRMYESDAFMNLFKNLLTKLPTSTPKFCET